MLRLTVTMITGVMVLIGSANAQPQKACNGLEIGTLAVSTDEGIDLKEEPSAIKIQAHQSYIVKSTASQSIVATGPVLTSADSHIVKTDILCTEEGATLVVTITRDANYPIAISSPVLPPPPWRPIISLTMLSRRPDIKFRVVWELLLSTGAIMDHSRSGVYPYNNIQYPIVVEKTLQLQADKTK